MPCHKNVSFMSHFHVFFFFSSGWWLSSSNAQMGAYTVVGYLLYRFSQSQSHDDTPVSFFWGEKNGKIPLAKKKQKQRNRTD